MPHSDPIEKHTLEKLEKLHELLKNDDQKPPFYVEFWLKSKKPHPHHRAELHLKTSMLDLHSHDEGPDLYVAIDNTIDKMVTLVRKEKAKKRDKYMKAENEKRAFTENDDKYTLS
jgi:ribosomal subunit interface protein